MMPCPRLKRLILAAMLGLLLPLAGRTSPQAGPTATPASGPAPLTVTFSPNNPNGSLYQWQFNFIPAAGFVPDYSSEIGEDVHTTYAAPGTYTARLRVYDAVTGSPLDTDFTITVLPPPAPPTVDVTFAPYPTLLDEPVTFTATAVPSPGRSIAAYSWDFDNDGSEDASSPGGPSATATSAFSLPQWDHTITVTAVDNGGLAGKTTAVVLLGGPPRMKITGPISRLTSPATSESFTVTATPVGPRTIDHYDWDFGDGTTGTSPGGGTATVPHAFAATGSYTVTATATDTAGHSSSTSIPVQVSTAPAALLARHECGPGMTAYTVMTLVPGGDSILGYHWDFKGDGADDAAYPASDTVVIPGDSTNKDPVSVTVDLNVAADLPATAPLKIEMVVAMVIPPIPMSMTATADGDPVTSPLDIRVGHVVKFAASAGNPASPGPVLKEILWDFDGDGLRDQLDNLLPLNAESVSDIRASYQYRVPGTFEAVARIIGTNGNDGGVKFKVNVLPGKEPLECYISQPRTGKKIWGNHVSVHAKTAPAVLTRQVEFRYRPSGTGSWTVIGTAAPPPYTSLGVLWDVTRLPPGDYDLLAAATDTSDKTVLSSALQPVTVTVDPLAPDEEENDGDVLVRTHVIDPNLATRSEIAGDTAIEFPPHAFLDYTTIRMERPFSNPHPLQARLQGLHFVPGSFRRLALDGGAGLQQPSKIALYDLNPRGVLDGLNVDKSKLKVYQFNGSRGEWEPLFGQVIQPGEDLARATLMSMGDVGLVVEPTARTPSASSSGGCGLLGPELLVLALLLQRRRRRV